jgi:two-component system nitrate/nitrite response regulator NarL
MTTLLVADDHPLMLDAVASLFREPEFQIVARCRDGLQAREAILAHRPDVAVLDIHMPRATGLELLAEARREGWPTRILLLTASVEAEPLLDAVRLKVDGLVLKGAAGDVLLRAVEAVAAGGQWMDRDAMEQVVGRLAAPDAPSLTPREADVVRLVVKGRRNKEIARDLGITEGTVKMHLHNIYEKLGVSSRTELALLARDQSLG